MSELKIKDFYGQNVTIHNGTVSGNVRIEVKTTKDLNKVKLTKPEDCDLVTDISLPMSQIRLIHSFLESLINEEEY